MARYEADVVTEIVLPKLPFALDALEPHMSRETLQCHHGKHHRKYVETVNQLISGNDHEGMSLEEIIQNSSGTLFNNAAQVWNHGFFWQCLTPRATTPSEELSTAIRDAFGSMEAFRTKFTQQAVALFGSGWTWLVRDADARLRIVNTANAGLPMAANQTALLACDVWEHAYYIDRRNDRAAWLQHFWPIVNWTFVSEKFASSAYEWANRGAEDRVDEASKESFPASDPPAHTPTQAGPAKRKKP